MRSGELFFILLLASCVSSNAEENIGHVRGWVPQPNGRGTIEIIFTSIFTIFVSCYTILCLNVPSRDESWHTVFARRVLWMGVSIAGPEFVLAAAAGQWAAAKRSEEDFKKAGYPTWTMRHAFFADMGGIELNPRDSIPFRINAKHLHWLVIHGYLPYPDLSLDEIDDKSKADTLSKLITTVQIAYLILQCIARAIQHLAITTLELFALAIVVCSIAISWCWLRKPVDVKLPLRLYMPTSTAELLINAGPAASRPYQQTPLDFIDDLKPSWSLNIQPFMHMPIGPFARPIPRFGNDRFPWLELPHSTALSFATLVYASVHMIAWNWDFPSHLERTLWRTSSAIILGSTAVFWLTESIAVWYRWNGGEKYLYQLRGKLDQYNEKEKGRQAAQSGDPTSIDHETGVQLPRPEPPPFPLVGEFWAMFVLALIYAAARMYLLVEAFYGLRELPASAFQDVNWTAFIPHV